MHSGWDTQLDCLRTRELLCRSFEADYRGLWSGFGNPRRVADTQPTPDFEGAARRSRIEESYKLFVGEMIQRREAILLALVPWR